MTGTELSNALDSCPAFTWCVRDHDDGVDASTEHESEPARIDGIDGPVDVFLASPGDGPITVCIGRSVDIHLHEARSLAQMLDRLAGLAGWHRAAVQG
jgi:hypothetical protein